MPERVRIFDNLLKEYVTPRLAELSFTVDQKRNYRLIDKKNSTVKIVNFQIGIRTLAGKFTVNLGVYNPQYYIGEGAPPSLDEAQEFHCLPFFRQRMGMLIENSWTKFFVRVLGPTDSIWKQILYGPKDKWWTYSNNRNETLKNVQSATDYLVKYGLPWLDKNINFKAMEIEPARIKEKIKKTAKIRPQ